MLEIIKPIIDLGPVTSFTGLPMITSIKQINITPTIPRTIKIKPFFFIYTSLIKLLLSIMFINDPLSKL